MIDLQYQGIVVGSEYGGQIVVGAQGLGGSEGCQKLRDEGGGDVRDVTRGQMRMSETTGRGKVGREGYQRQTSEECQGRCERQGRILRGLGASGTASGTSRDAVNVKDIAQLEGH
jgi:hypothetical protein